MIATTRSTYTRGMTVRAGPVFLVSACLALTACGGGDVRERDEPGFISEMREIHQLDPVSDELLVDFGDSVCKISRAANSADEYTDALFTVIGGEDAEMLAVYTLQAGNALGYLCPDQAERWGN